MMNEAAIKSSKEEEQNESGVVERQRVGEEVNESERVLKGTESKKGVVDGKGSEEQHSESAGGVKQKPAEEQTESERDLKRKRPEDEPVLKRMESQEGERGDESKKGKGVAEGKCSEDQHNESVGRVKQKPDEEQNESERELKRKRPEEEQNESAREEVENVSKDEHKESEGVSSNDNQSPSCSMLLRKKISLRTDQLGPILQANLGDWEKYATDLLDTRRMEKPVKTPTHAKAKEHMLMFIGYLQLKGYAIDSLAVVLSSLTVIMTYVYEFLRDVRGNSAGSLLTHMNSFVTVFKYITSIQPTTSLLASLSVLQSKRNEINRSYDKEQKDKANLGDTDHSRLPWEAFQLMIKQLHESYEESVASGEFGRHRQLHDLLLCLFQCALTPSRVVEIRLTQFVTTPPSTAASGNFLYKQDGVYYWRTDLFKNNATFGKTQTAFPENFPLLTELMDEYLTTSKKELLKIQPKAKQSSFLFLHGDGLEFVTTAHFTTYFNRLVFKQIGTKNVGFNVLRISAVEFVRKNSDSTLLFHSLAHSMRHSMQLQERYNKATSVDKNKLAVQYVSDSLKNVLESEEGPRRQQVFSVGDIVATVAEDNKTIWLGKIVSHHLSANDYHLQHLQKIENTRRSYSCGKPTNEPWVENHQALMAVETSYCPISNQFTLQTTKKDILSQFKNT
jgi:hypothetical protein